MAVVGSFASRSHAEMAASMLSAHGIPATVIGDDAGGAAPHLNLGAGGGYALDVPEDEREAATELLAGDAPATDTTSGSTASEGARAGRVLVALAAAAVLAGIVWSAAA